MKNMESISRSHTQNTNETETSTQLDHEIDFNVAVEEIVEAAQQEYAASRLADNFAHNAAQLALDLSPAPDETEPAQSEIVLEMDDGFNEIPSDQQDIENKYGKLDPALLPESEQNPAMEWGQSNEDGTIEEQEYEKRLDFRLSGCGFLLDKAADQISTEAEAEEWAELKQIIAEGRHASGWEGKFDYILVEQAVWDFCQPRGATYDDYLHGRSW